jgi:serine/threonine protein kinase
MGKTDVESMNGTQFAQGEIIGGRYKVLSLLGKGGMGLVYRVEQIILGEELALKTIHKTFLTDTTIKRFEQEARTAFAVNHANIIAVKAFGLLDDQTPFLAMEIVNGETLAETTARLRAATNRGGPPHYHSSLLWPCPCSRLRNSAPRHKA